MVLVLMMVSVRGLVISWCVDLMGMGVFLIEGMNWFLLVCFVL